MIISLFMMKQTPMLRTGAARAGRQALPPDPEVRQEPRCEREKQDAHTRSNW
jgi:hypothetical protein